MNFLEVDAIIKRALAEDIGTGDITTLCCVPEGSRSSAALRAKEPGVVCGIGVFRRVMELCDPAVVTEEIIPDGGLVNRGDVIARVSGPSRAILTAERTALNLLQRMSGIATRSREAANSVRGSGARVTDTRKTTPGLRILEKYAVRTGGALNHRFNLCDGILIKDNHIAASGGISNAVSAVRKSAPHTLKIEVETTNLGQVEEALACNVDIIMLDNMSLSEMEEAVRLIAGRALTEASGNMGERDLREVAATGIDLISVGSLTHSASALDISLQFD